MTTYLLSEGPSNSKLRLDARCPEWLKSAMLDELGACGYIGPRSNGTSMTGKILVVDDDAANRELLEELLRNNSFDVVTARDGREAIDTFAERQPDLVLLDAVMPGLDGFEVCRELKGRPESRLTPVVLVTGLSDIEDRVRGIEADADDFLHKPVDPGELLARVRSLLRLKHYTDELERAEIVLMALARSIEAKDPYTEGHCERLSKLAVDLGRRLRLSADELEALRRGGTVHDI